MNSRLSISRVALAALLLSACGDSAQPGGFEEGHEPGISPDGTPDPTSDSGAPGKPSSDGGREPVPPGETDAGVSPDGSTPQTPATPSAPLAANVGIAEIAIYQGVKISLYKNGASVTTRNAPVVAGRQAFVRVFATRKTGYTGAAVIAELRLVPPTGATVVLRDTKAVPTSATDAQVASTFNFDVPATALPEGVRFQVALTDSAAPAGQANKDAQWPAAAPEDLQADSTGAQLKVVLVPFRYSADGSGRVPDTSAATVQKYKDELFKMYPAARVDVTVHAPYDYSTSIAASGSGFDAALNAMVRLRATEKPTRDVYYYGIFLPAASFNTYCRGGCVTGLSGLASNSADAGIRASVGVGFAENGPGTAAHEIGHAHGLPHAPCGGPSGPDPNYPYAGGVIGVWGYDLVAKKLIDPSAGKDFMGYCPNSWISDYNYKKLYNRVKLVNGARIQPAPAAKLQIANVDDEGAVALGESTDFDEAPVGEARAVSWVDGRGRVVAQSTGQYFPYDHLPGGMLLVGEGPANTRAVLSP